MTKYIFIAAVFLAIVCLYLNIRVDVLKKENSTLTAEKKELIAEIERRENDIVEISKRKRELEKAISDDKSGFDWSYRIGNSVPVRELQKQCVSCPTRAN